MSARIKFTYYLDVISSWCFYAEPMITELKNRYADDLDYCWKTRWVIKRTRRTLVIRRCERW